MSPNVWRLASAVLFGVASQGGFGSRELKAWGGKTAVRPSGSPFQQTPEDARRRASSPKRPQKATEGHFNAMFELAHAIMGVGVLHSSTLKTTAIEECFCELRKLLSQPGAFFSHC